MHLSPTEVTALDPVTAANELIALAHVAIDEGRPSQPYLDHAEAILNAEERGADTAPALAAAFAFLTR